MTIFEKLIEAVVLESQVAIDPQASAEEKAQQRAAYIVERLSGGGIDQPLVLKED